MVLNGWEGMTDNNQFIIINVLIRFLCICSNNSRTHYYGLPSCINVENYREICLQIPVVAVEDRV